MIQEISYSILYNHFYNLGETILIEIRTKLGNLESRRKNIYYARFIMLLANHVAPTMVVDQPENHVGMLCPKQEIVQGPSKDQLTCRYCTKNATCNTCISLHFFIQSKCFAFNYLLWRV